MPNDLKNYDQKTLDYVRAAKSVIARNHGLEAQRDPAEVMREQNAKIHDAAKVVKRKKGMVRQTPVKMKQQVAPAPESISDIKNEADYDSYMGSLFPQKQRGQRLVANVPVEAYLPPVEDVNPFADDDDEQGVSPEVAMDLAYKEGIPMSQFAQPEAPRPQMVRQQIKRGGRSVINEEPAPVQEQELSSMVRPVRHDYDEDNAQAENPGEQEARILNEAHLRSYNGQGNNAAPNPQFKPWTLNVPPRTYPEITDHALAQAQKDAGMTSGIDAAIAYANEQKPQQPRMSEARKTYDTFTDVRGLPSEGKFYDAVVMGQSLKLGDIMLLGDIDDDNQYESISELYTRRLRGVAPDDILSADNAYLLHWLKASSFPDQPLPITYSMVCPSCEGKIDSYELIKDINLRFDDLIFDAGDVDSVLAKHANGYYAFTMPDGRECNVYLRRRSHDREVNEVMKQYLHDTKKAMPRYMEFILRTAVVIEIEGCENIKEKMDYLENLTPVEADTVLDELNSASLKTEIKARIRCPLCGKEVTVPYPFRFDEYMANIR